MKLWCYKKSSDELSPEYIKALCKEMHSHKICINRSTQWCRMPVAEIRKTQYNDTTVFDSNQAICNIAKFYIDHITLVLAEERYDDHRNTYVSWEDPVSRRRQELAMKLIRAIRG